jgi:hypothetical protein
MHQAHQSKHVTTWAIAMRHSYKSGAIRHRCSPEGSGHNLCAILANPAAFNNKMVRIRGSFVGNFEYSELTDAACHGQLWLRYGGSTLVASVQPTNELGSEDSEGKRLLPVPVILVRDSKFERFDALVRLNTGRYGPSSDQRVTATFVGRIDAVSNEVHDYFQKQPIERRFMLGFGQGGFF